MATAVAQPDQQVLHQLPASTRWQRIAAIVRNKRWTDGSSGFGSRQTRRLSDVCRCCNTLKAAVWMRPTLCSGADRRIRSTRFFFPTVSLPEQRTMSDKNPPQPEPQPESAKPASAQPQPETVEAVRKFIQRLGGIDQAREALNTLKKLHEDAA